MMSILTTRSAPATSPATATVRMSAVLARTQGLTLAHFRAQREDLRDTSLTVELNLSTLGTHPRVDMGHMGDKLSLS